MPLEGGEPRELSSQGQVTVGLAWTADSREIIYAKTPTLAGVLGGLWRIPASGGEPTAVPAAGQDVRYPAVSPQGNRLVYERADFDANLWAYPLPGDNSGASPRQVAASTYVDHEPRISPDGNRIVFASNRTGRFQIWVSDRDGANIVQLTSLDGWGAGSPRWSPNGRYIAFDSNVHGNWDISVVDALGGSPRWLTISEARDTRPSWSHDGSERTGTGQIWKVSPDGEGPTQVTRAGGHQPFESPDGRFLYFTRGPSDFSVWRIPVEAGEEKAVQLVPNAANWVVEENGLYFVEYREAMPDPGEWYLRLLASDAAQPVDVMEVPPPWWASGLDIAPDGKWFVYAQSQLVGSDLMLIENFE
jgi:Tol biopolymer transport system component